LRERQLWLPEKKKDLGSSDVQKRPDISLMLLSIIFMSGNIRFGWWKKELKFLADAQSVHLSTFRREVWDGQKRSHQWNSRTNASSRLNYKIRKWNTEESRKRLRVGSVIIWEKKRLKPSTQLQRWPDIFLMLSPTLDLIKQYKYITELL